MSMRESSMQAGRLVGIVLLVLSIPGILFSFGIVDFGDTVPKLLLTGPSLFLLGLALMIFPGAPMTVAELNAKVKPKSYLWKGAPLLHRVIWVVALIIGSVASVYYATQLGF